MLRSVYHWIFVTTLLEVMCLSSTFNSPVRIKDPFPCPVTTEITRKVCITLYAPHNEVSSKNSEGDQCVYCTGSNCSPMREPSLDSIILHICHVSVVHQDLKFNPGDTLLPCLKHKTGTALLSELNSMNRYIQSSLENMNRTDSKATEIKCDVDLLQNLKNTLKILNLKDPYTYQPILDLINGLKLESLKKTGPDSDINGITNNVLKTLQHLKKLIFGLTILHQLNNTNNSTSLPYVSGGNGLATDPSDTPVNISDVDYTNNEVLQHLEPEKETNPSDTPENIGDVDYMNNEVFQHLEPEKETNPSDTPENIGDVDYTNNEVFQHMEPEKEINSKVPDNEADLEPFIDALFQQLKPQNEPSLNEDGKQVNLDWPADEGFSELKPENETNLNGFDKEDDLDSLIDETFPEVKQENRPSLNEDGKQVNLDSPGDEGFSELKPGKEISPDLQAMTSHIKLILQHLDKIIHGLIALQHLNITGNDEPALIEFNSIINSTKLPLLQLTSIKTDLSVFLALSITGSVVPSTLDFTRIINSIQSTLNLLNKLFLNLSNIHGSIQKAVGIIGHPLPDFPSIIGSIQSTLPLLKPISSHDKKKVVGIIGHPLPNHSSLTGSIKLPHLTFGSIKQPKRGTAENKLIYKIGYGSVIGKINSSMDSFYRIIVELSSLKILISSGESEFKGIINSHIQDLVAALNIKVSAESQTLDLLIEKAQLILEKLTMIIDDLHTLHIGITKGTDQSALVDKITQSILDLGFHFNTKPLNFNIKVLLPALHGTGSVLNNIVEKFLQLKERFEKIACEFSPRAILNTMIGMKRTFLLKKLLG